MQEGHSLSLVFTWRSHHMYDTNINYDKHVFVVGNFQCMAWQCASARAFSGNSTSHIHCSGNEASPFDTILLQQAQTHCIVDLCASARPACICLTCAITTRIPLASASLLLPLQRGAHLALWLFTLSISKD